jgi:DNA primase
MNSPESPVFDKSRSLLGLFQQAAAIRSRQRVVLVEGNFDMLSLVVHGCPNVVAPLGTALTRPQLKMLRHYAENAILLFDGDAAGVKAAVRAVPLFLAEQMGARVALLPTGHDPDTFIREQGLKKMEQLLDSATPLAEFALNKLIEEHGLSLDGKRRIIEELRPLVQAAADPMQRSMVISHFSDKLGLDKQEFKNLLAVHLPGAVPSSEAIKQQAQQAKRAQQCAAETKVFLRLNNTQIRLITHMILYPVHFPRLEEAGVRHQLAGSVGEVVFLQIKALYASQPSFEPEALPVALPEGEERTFVEQILQSASADLYRGTEEELAELLLWLKQGNLLRISEELKMEIFRTEHAGGDVGELMQQKQKVDADLQVLKEQPR